MTTATAARFPLPSDADDVAPDLAATTADNTTYTTNGATPLPPHRTATVSALSISGDARGDWRVQNVSVAVELEGVDSGDLRAFVADLDDTIAAGRDTVADAVRTAAATDGELRSLKQRAIEAGQGAVAHLEQLAAARERLDAAKKATEHAIRTGGDFVAAEKAEAATADEIRVLERRREIAGDEFDRAQARVRGREDQLARDVRRRLLAEATQELDDLGREVAGYVFARLRRHAELRGLVNATAPSR